MFDYCKHKKTICDFSVNGIYCGIGKGESRIDDIKSCDGKHPVFKNIIRNSPKQSSDMFK